MVPDVSGGQKEHHALYSIVSDASVVFKLQPEKKKKKRGNVSHLTPACVQGRPEVRRAPRTCGGSFPATNKASYLADVTADVNPTEAFYFLHQLTQNPFARLAAS